MLLEAEGMTVFEAATAAEATDAASRHQPDVVVLDHRMGGEVPGAELAPVLRNRCSRSRIVMFSAVLADDGRWLDAVDAVVDKVDAERLVRVVLSLIRPPDRRSTVTRGAAG